MTLRRRAALAVAFAIVPALQAQTTVERVSVTSAGQEGNGPSYAIELSDDARFTLFTSDATNLVPGDTNGVADAFVRDRQLGSTERVTVGAGGIQANGTTTGASLSGDGRYACFSSSATNLVAGDSNGVDDVFLRDRLLGTTERISQTPAGTQWGSPSDWPVIARGGRYVVYRNHAGLTYYRLYRRDLQLGLTELSDELPANYTRWGSSRSPSLSADGRYVAFEATVQIAGSPSVTSRIFVRDMQTGSTIEASSVQGTPSNSTAMTPAFSPDGQWIAFLGWGSNLVPGFTPDTYGALFMHDLVNGTNEVISTTSTGVISRGSNYFAHGISAGGRFVTLVGGGNALVPADTNQNWDVFLKDRLTGSTRRVSATATGAQLASGGWGGQLTPDGRFLVLNSDSPALVAGDANGTHDVFVLDLAPPQAQSFCTGLPSSLGCTPALAASGTPSLSSAQPFTLACTNLVNQQPAWISYSVAPSARPFHGGTLCIERPIVQLALLSSGGSTSGSDCTGSYAIDFNQRIQSGLDARLVPGTLVCVQAFGHDPQAAGGYTLSPGLAFTVQP